MKNKAEILKEILNHGFPENEVAVSIDDFFNNENYSGECIGVNIYPDPPAPGKFHEIFKELIASKQADKVYVRISDIEEPKNWFYSDTVYIIGSSTTEGLKSSLESLCPDEIYEGFMYGKPINIPDIDIGKQVFSVWWD